MRRGQSGSADARLGVFGGLQETRIREFQPGDGQFGQDLVDGAGQIVVVFTLADSGREVAVQGGDPLGRIDAR